MAADTVTEEDCGAGDCCAWAPQIPRINRAGRMPPSHSARVIDRRIARRNILGISKSPSLRLSPSLTYCCGGFGVGAGLGAGAAGGGAGAPGAGGGAAPGA